MLNRQRQWPGNNRSNRWYVHKPTHLFSNTNKIHQTHKNDQKTNYKIPSIKIANPWINIKIHHSHKIRKKPNYYNTKIKFPLKTHSSFQNQISDEIQTFSRITQMDPRPNESIPVKRSFSINKIYIYIESGIYA